MTTKKQPLNSDILRELKAMGTRLGLIDDRLRAAELYIQAEKMYAKALKQVYHDRQQQDSTKEVSAKTELLINLGKLVGLLIVAVGAYLAGKGLQ